MLSVCRNRNLVNKSVVPSNLNFVVLTEPFSPSDFRQTCRCPIGFDDNRVAGDPGPGADKIATGRLRLVSLALRGCVMTMLSVMVTWIGFAGTSAASWS